MNQAQEIAEIKAARRLGSHLVEINQGEFFGRIGAQVGVVGQDVIVRFPNLKFEGCYTELVFSPGTVRTLPISK